MDLRNWVKEKIGFDLNRADDESQLDMKKWKMILYVARIYAAALKW